MNPRIYKKQAKRALEIMKSHGIDISDFFLSEDPGVEDYPFRTNRWRRLRKFERRAWERIKRIPYQCWSDYYGECDCVDARNHWYRVNDFGGTMRFSEAGDLLPPLVRNHYILHQWSSTKAIATGWRWRGGKAVRESK